VLTISHVVYLNAVAFAWKEALEDMWQPILTSMPIVVSGFALFLLSDFLLAHTKTRRLGVDRRCVDRHCRFADVARSGNVPSHARTANIVRRIRRNASPWLGARRDTQFT
jgi:hypothetical protein